jgi:hypothetical protein
MNVRPRFLWSVGIFFLCGLLVIASAYFSPHINLPRPSRAFCPILTWLKPLSKAPVQSTDSLELVTFVGKPTTPYTVRIYGDGRVERDTVVWLMPVLSTGCPLHDADKHLQIPAAQAAALIAKARDGGFCRLCQIYESTHASENDGYDQLTLSFHGKTNRALNSSGNPPPLFPELVSSMSKFSSIPDYATAHRPSKERMTECNAYSKAQMDILFKRLEKR